jgi:uncharacterized LabA/DUF88 family protein
MVRLAKAGYSCGEEGKRKRYGAHRRRSRGSGSCNRAACTCHARVVGLLFGHNSPAVFIPSGCIAGGGRKRFTKQAAARRLRRSQTPNCSIRMKTVVYVDGFNLYYGALRGTPFKWLDLYGLFQEHVLEPGTRLEQVRYYTAPVKGSASDDSASPQRQQCYLRALKAYRGNQIEIVLGFISRTTASLRFADPPQGSTRGATVRVFQFTEKQTDVNLTADLISDAWRGHYEQAVVCSNDTDLVGGLRAVRRDHAQVTIGIVAPLRDRRYMSAELRKLAHWHNALSAAHLASAQLPQRIPGTSLTRPESWK